jgi:hypothetical protein
MELESRPFERPLKFKVSRPIGRMRMPSGISSMMSRAKRSNAVRLAILLATAMAVSAQSTSQAVEHTPYPSGQGYFLFSNMPEVIFCDEMPKSIPRTTTDVEQARCLKVRTKTVRREDLGEKPSLFDLKNLYGLAFWISLLPAAIAVCCFTDKPGVARLGGAAAKFIELLSTAKGPRKSILTLAVRAVMASPLLFAVAWGGTRHSTLTVMIDNAQNEDARIEIGDVKTFTVPRMSRVFVYLDHAQLRIPIHVTSTTGHEERGVLKRVWNDEGMPWVYDVGGANQDHVAYATYTRR